ncbi:hypothetical protein [Natronolimnobius baerhuensis]|uniref:CHAT domain-containing protein n=1 Tax=Natronolimnobius baerhuensis TaxID=253108 RepID=A0A202ED38_9EURY|nr:hypothetical protein [Natronolimnobius baerhuensis]OVE86154.1 hypothetical protein B2G88_05020 [Natronolimnobius baerhuensis]
MIEWERTGSTLRVTDSASAELAVRGVDQVSACSTSFPRPIDDTLAVSTSELSLPHAVVYAFSLTSDTRYELDPNGGTLTLPPDEYVIDIDAEIKTYVRLNGRATLTQTDGFESITLSLPEQTRVILGFRSRNELPVGTITVPDHPDAIAEAITHLGTAHRTDTPDRTYPTLRGHPPLLEAGDTLEIPAHLQTECPDTGIELVVPPAYEALYSTAPLAYYLQASVQTDSRLEHARLRLADFDTETRLAPLPTLEDDVAQLLRKTFFLDCLVRNVGPYGTTLSELKLVDALGLESEQLYEATPQERLAAYLEIPHEAIEHRLPEWHLATYVTPAYDRLETLPFLLDRMSLIYQPRTTELEGQELVERSLDDFYRGVVPPTDRDHNNEVPSRRQPSSDSNEQSSRTGPTRNQRSQTESATRASAGDVASVEVVKPELHHGRTHGWLADGVPIDVFKSDPVAYRNRLAALADDSNSSAPMSIHVVLNDPEMAGEHEAVAEIYRRRAEDRSIDVTVDESLRTADLARVFERNHDFVHYIGHCETDGLRCPDGNLAVSSLERCRAQTFFLNACGSFYEGQTLIEKGSVAGAVTFTKVLNDHALKVGSSFATFLAHGFSIERAMSLARSRIMMGKDYAVVGDGTHSLTDGEHQQPTTLTLEPVPDDDSDTAVPNQFLVTFDCYSTQTTGTYYVPHTDENELATLCGNESNFLLERDEVATLLEECDAAVIYNGDVYWSRELSTQF